MVFTPIKRVSDILSYENTELQSQIESKCVPQDVSYTHILFCSKGVNASYNSPSCLYAVKLDGILTASEIEEWIGTIKFYSEEEGNLNLFPCNFIYLPEGVKEYNIERKFMRCHDGTFHLVDYNNPKCTQRVRADILLSEQNYREGGREEDASIIKYLQNLEAEFNGLIKARQTNPDLSAPAPQDDSQADTKAGKTRFEFIELTQANADRLKDTGYKISTLQKFCKSKNVKKCGKNLYSCNAPRGTIVFRKGRYFNSPQKIRVKKKS